MLKHTLFQCQRILIAFAVFCFLTASAASARQQLYGHVPKEVATAPLIGEVADTETFQLAIGLPWRNSDGLQTLIQNLYDINNPQYHQFLTPDQFTQQFGPTAEDYQKLVDFVTSNGLSVLSTSPNRALLMVKASAADVRRIFHVNLHYYQRPDGTKFYAPDSEPSVDLDLPLSRISGLDDFAVPYPNFVVRGKRQNYSNLKINSSTGSGPAVDGYPYWGFDFRTIYACGSSLTGSGQNIALFELDDYKASNIATYEGDTGVGSPSITKVVVGSGFSSPQGGEPEVELDIEMAISMAPSANVYVYETNTSTFAGLDNLLNTIANPGPTNPLCYQISSSWSWGGSTDSSAVSIFSEYAAQGQSYFQASGDLGAYVAGDPETTPPNPQAETGLMTVVGGTALTTTGSSGLVGNWMAETTWNQVAASGEPTTEPTPQNLASSGGICSAIPIPTYQVPFDSGAGSNASTSFRNIPDVSMIAENIAIYTNIPASEGGSGNGIYVVGGTSAAAPLWAGFMALLNQQAKSQTKGPIGFANPYLYNAAASPTPYFNNFHDINDNSSNNYWGSQPVSFKAVAGYDLATGLGSPQCALITGIVAPLATNTQTFTPTVTRTPTITPTPTNSPTITNTPTPPTTTTSYAYPQPASGQVYICFNSNSAQQIQINVYSFSGQLITSVTDNAQASNQNRIPISLQGISPGVYFYVIRNSGGVMCTGKFLAVP